MKVVRVSQEMRQHFTSNELYGWPDGYKWTPTGQCKRMKRARSVKVKEPVKIESGVNCCIAPNH